MTRQIDRHNIAEQLYIYKQDNSKRWYARFAINGKWISKGTKEIDKNKAIIKAAKLQSQHEYASQNNIPYMNKRFKHVAQLAIERMESEINLGTGKESFKDYIRTLKKYHIPYFNNTYITSIQNTSLQSFDRWRIQLANRTLKKSTLLTHNAAMNRVFDEAEIRGWITTSQRPKLSTKGSTSSDPITAFTKLEIKNILADIDWFNSGRKQITREIKQLLYDYIIIAVHTGIRPGTEMEHLKWHDITTIVINGESYYNIQVRKGKTTHNTGPRAVTSSNEIRHAIQRLKKRNQPIAKTGKVFSLPDGRQTKELSRTFSRYLLEQGLKESPDGSRRLYSLRHTYITWQLEAGVEPAIIAAQCGTSIEMISKFYSHIKSPAHAKQLAGNKKTQISDPLATSAKSVNIGSLKVKVDSNGNLKVEK